MPRGKQRKRRSIRGIGHAAAAEEFWESIGPGVERFRMPEGEPVRRIITRGGVRKVGGFFSWKMLDHVVHESGPERQCAMLMDLHPSIRAFSAQPETIRFELEGRPVRYTPDFLVDVVPGIEIRTEVKRLADLFPPRPTTLSDDKAVWLWEKAKKTRARLRAVRSAYESCGLRWTLLLDVAIAAMGNPDVVEEVGAHGGRHLSDADRKRLIDFLVERGGTAPLGAAAAQLAEADDPKGCVLARVSERLLAIDLLNPVSDDTLITLVS